MEIANFIRQRTDNPCSFYKKAELERYSGKFLKILFELTAMRIQRANEIDNPPDFDEREIGKGVSIETIQIELLGHQYVTIDISLEVCVEGLKEVVKKLESDGSIRVPSDARVAITEAGLVTLMSR